MIDTCGLLGVEPWACRKDMRGRFAEGDDPATLAPRLRRSARARS
jgi:hypothetical protein